MKFNSILFLFLLTAFLLFFSSNNMFAQADGADSSFYQTALLKATGLYHQSFGSQSALYNGSKYGEYLFKFNEGQPYYNSPAPVFGSVIYDGIMYDSVKMRYDEVKDALVVDDRSDRIQLLSEKVSYFKLFNSNFIRLEKDSLTNALISSGFYNILYKGKISLLKKEVKTVREAISSTAELQHFADEKDHYYIKKDGRIYSIKRKKDLFKLLRDQKKEVQQFIKANKLSFRRNRQNMLIRATAFYDSLKK